MSETREPTPNTLTLTSAAVRAATDSELTQWWAVVTDVSSREWLTAEVRRRGIRMPEGPIGRPRQ